jgi:hypothetical protein
MGTLERTYRQRLSAAFAEIDQAETPPASPEEAFQRFFELMEAVMPVIDRLPRPQVSNDNEPDELGLYRQWRELEARRRQ